MFVSVQNPVPEVYLLWHPACNLGGFLAPQIYQWLRPVSGIGPQVFYRSAPAPEAPAGGLPLGLPGEIRLGGSQMPGSPTLVGQSLVTNVQIVLILIDEHMVADPTWRYWLAQLSQSPSSVERKLMPVALDSSAYNIASNIREKNFLRPAGLPLPSEPAKLEDAKQYVSRSLLRQITEAMCRLLLGRRIADLVPPNPIDHKEGFTGKIKIFLSHAKSDGTAPARRLRDYIYSQTQLAAFYDENDIPFGAAFSRVLEDDLQADETAALIAVRSANYASRPWCRRELSLFRRPVPSEIPVPGMGERWRLNPMLVVDALENSQQSSGIPELGNTSIIRWSDEGKDPEEKIVTTLLRDVMLAEFHTALGRKIPSAANRLIINWLPDPTSLLRLPRVSMNEELEIVYPGRGLSALELDILTDFFPKLEFLSFEGALDALAPVREASNPRRYRSKASESKVVGLSLSHDPESLMARGLGIEHLQELLKRLARPLVRQGAGIAYGGNWDNKPGSPNFTLDLLRLVSAEQEDRSLIGQSTGVAIGRVYNHSGWPSYLDVTPAIEAQWINSCQIVRVTQKDAGIDDADHAPDDIVGRASDRAVLNTAITLSAMRRFAVEGMLPLSPDVPSPEPIPAISARVILGGKTRGYFGFVPGIFEEALLAMEKKLPLYIFGGFGGAAGVLASALLGTETEGPVPPNEFTLQGQLASNPKLAPLLDLAAKLPMPANVRITGTLLAELFSFIVRARQELSAVLNTGLTEAESRELLVTRDMGRAIQLVQKGLEDRLKLKRLPA